MKFIKNYNDWIDPGWIEFIKNNPGQARPRDWPAASESEKIEYQKYHEAGYDLNAVHWWIYEKQDLNVDLYPPWCAGKIHWWFTKLNPGQFMPIHSDPHVFDKPCNRYWMPLQNYVAGHVFISRDSMITNYRKGDVFQFANSTDLHGAANIGHSTRIMLLITEYV